MMGEGGTFRKNGSSFPNPAGGARTPFPRQEGRHRESRCITQGKTVPSIA